MSRTPIPCAPGVAFGKVVALEPRGSDKSGARLWLFECSCGAPPFVGRVVNAVANAEQGQGGCKACRHESARQRRRRLTSLVPSQPSPSPASIASHLLDPPPVSEESPAR